MIEKIATGSTILPDKINLVGDIINYKLSLLVLLLFLIVYLLSKVIKFTKIETLYESNNSSKKIDFNKLILILQSKSQKLSKLNFYTSVNYIYKRYLSEKYGLDCLSLTLDELKGCIKENEYSFLENMYFGEYDNKEDNKDLRNDIINNLKKNIKIKP